ncbi:hydrogenase formation protein HypD [Nitratifractor salsuginis]|uniref:Hydrogenase expression/formation protein HypD n=1 Tax=Nitratifractor salsuginis (strain DSM 16511 / JCM 12458 / E9I37-1) TaxID=749222 RepID=E6WYB2_NITSE|nr:hydrogenase formation protein HypD [Nitratifractor salsuginis]ADV45360.1 hydrogenase expression/formation protein HypD [Nitratifractor salsuginis DSM 16511]
MNLTLKNLYDDFRDPKTIKALAELITQEAEKLDRPVNIMEVCGGHTHTIMKYGLKQLLPEKIRFIHGPGCPVCIMPKERIDHAYILAQQPDVILVTLGDMIKVPGSKGSLQQARSQGADVRFVYSPLDALKIARENPEKRVIFFAIGFETTTPMTAALIDRAEKLGVTNLLYHINHVTVPEVMRELIDSRDEHIDSYNNRIDAFIGPSHVSVIAGAKIYREFPERYGRPVVVSGFEPVDVMEGVLMLVRQFTQGRCELEIQYRRSVTMEGNLSAQRQIDKFFEKRELFKWRGLGNIPHSALKLREAYAHLDAEKVYGEQLPVEEIEDHKLCICGDILRGMAEPTECQVFGTACTPSKPLGSCMVSSEGACAAYYKYGDLLQRRSDR